jgi:hypothetical protein
MSERSDAMNDTTADFAPSDEDVLVFEVSDAALEAAATVLPGTAVSFPNSPTVSIVFACCSNE